MDSSNTTQPTPPTQPLDYPYLLRVVRTAEQLVYAAGRDKKRLRNALQEILEDMLPWLKDDISSSEASTARTPSPEIALEDLSETELLQMILTQSYKLRV